MMNVRHNNAVLVMTDLVLHACMSVRVCVCDNYLHSQSRASYHVIICDIQSTYSFNTNISRHVKS